MSWLAGAIGPPFFSTTRGITRRRVARVTGREITQIYEGTNQVERIVMARQLLAGVQSEL